MFSKVAIVGVGLLGGSLARELRTKRLANTVVGVCRSEKSRQMALQLDVVDDVTDLQSAVRGADLVVMATPMQAMLPLLQQIEPELGADAVVTDVGSVKTSLYQELKIHCPELLRQFVFAHPIAGGEDAGVSASR
ncbi:MAG: prephenate dehydrogenase/arogenate dehydrogenase family protein, partial [Arenicella sp.]|nr:prephenate dehydrogenase/arogenate dehydrogenase family protein [Arenicella sp.]